MAYTAITRGRASYVEPQWSLRRGASVITKLDLFHLGGTVTDKLFDAKK